MPGLSVSPSEGDARGRARHRDAPVKDSWRAEMRRNLARLTLVALVALALPLASAAQYREFTGRIDKINKKRVIVDNRMGDKVSFIPGNPTEVSGRGKEKWKNLKKNDWVTVSWKMIDKPRVAYKVKVLEPKKESGEDL